MKVAPHDAELIEADATEIYRAGCRRRGYPARAWPELAEETREFYRQLASDPYSLGRPRP